MRLRRSSDSGVTWTTNALPGQGWTAIACSADGTRIAGVGDGNSIYTSTDAGATWTTAAVPHGKWISVASSADGNALVAAIQGGSIYTCRTTPAPVLSLAASPGNRVLSWTVPSRKFVPRQSPDLDLTNWSDIPGSTMLNCSNLCHEITVPAASGAMFYRLESR